MPWRINRGGQEQVLQVQPKFSRPEGRWLTGIMIGSDSGNVVISNVSKGSPADRAGLQADDVVTEVNGQSITGVDDLINAVQLNGDSQMEWGLVRNGIERYVVVTARFQQPEGEMWLTGASTSLTNSYIDTRSSPPWVALGNSFVRTWEVLVLLKQGVTGAFSQGGAPQLSGPVGIAQITGEVTREGGLAGWMAITILLSINLAILNILPIPMLDGGRLVFVVLEWLRRGKRVPPEKEGMVHLIGFVVLIGLIVIISANDISRLVQGQSFLGG
jgi:regulator of sigma E protease